LSSAFTVFLLFFFFFYFLSFFVSYLLISLNGSTKTGHMLRSECDLKMHLQNLGYPFSENWGPKTTFYRQLRNLAAALNAYIFGTKRESGKCILIDWLIEVR